MKLEIEATDKITTVDGVDVRLWNGKTKDGTNCVVMVHRIVACADSPELERALQRMPPPKFFPLHTIV